MYKGEIEWKYSERNTQDKAVFMNSNNWSHAVNDSECEDDKIDRNKKKRRETDKG